MSDIYNRLLNIFKTGNILDTNDSILVIPLNTCHFYCIHRKIPVVLLNILNVLSLSKAVLHQK